MYNLESEVFDFADAQTEVTTTPEPSVLISVLEDILSSLKTETLLNAMLLLKPRVRNYVRLGCEGYVPVAKDNLPPSDFSIMLAGFEQSKATIINRVAELVQRRTSHPVRIFNTQPSITHESRDEDVIKALSDIAEKNLDS